MAQTAPTARVSTRCGAPPDAVYGLLADLSSHLHWAGEKQRRDFRVISLDAPAGPARAGTVFTSAGTIPMSRRRWADSSRVTVADRGRTFEFVTDATAGRGPRAMTARYVHRYEIAAAGNGSTIAYTLTQESISNPMLRVGLPGVRAMTWRVMLPMFVRRGLRNLARAAELSASTQLTAAES